MGRSILAVIAGYLTMAILVMVTLSVAFIAIGADRAYKPDSFEVSNIWLVIWGLSGLVSAKIGGFVCRRIAGRVGPVFGLVGLVVVLGVASAWYTMRQPRNNEARTGDVALSDAMTKAIPPAWVPYGNIVLGVAGVLLGGCVLGARKGEAAPKEDAT